MTGSSLTSSCAFVVHGHFYQPPRRDPFSGTFPNEPNAAPYPNWNARIAAESYAPIAESGFFSQLSFNVGSTLIDWLEVKASDTYRRIIADERNYFATHGVANGLAQPIHHIILPLARRRDKRCQVRWGLASYDHHFGHAAEGMWLPEMAVDLETLQVLAEEGVFYVILSDEQVRGSLDQGAGPYWVALPGGGRIAVFVRDRQLSNALSFGMPDSAYVGEWIEYEIVARCHDGKRLLVAMDGETFGHHHRQGVFVLKQIMAGSNRYPYRLAALGSILRQNPPQAEIEVIENSAWSCAHRLERWAIGCSDTLGDSRWKGALRRALDNLASEMDCLYAAQAREMDFSPYDVRDRYIAVTLGQISPEQFLVQHGLGHLSSTAVARLLGLLEAQRYRQRMYTSCAFFFEDLERYEPQYAIASAAKAIVLTRKATGDDLFDGFRRDLAVAVSGRTGRDGAAILDEIIARAEVS